MNAKATITKLTLALLLTGAISGCDGLGLSSGSSPLTAEDFSIQRLQADAFMIAVSKADANEASKHTLKNERSQIGVNALTRLIQAKFDSNKLKTYSFEYVSERKMSETNYRVVYAEIINGQKTLRNVVADMEFDSVTQRWLVKDVLSH